MKSYVRYRHQELSHTELDKERHFPDVTLCNLYPIRRDRVLSATDLVFKYFELPFYVDETCETTYYQVNYPIEIGNPEAFMRMMNGM